MTNTKIQVFLMNAENIFFFRQPICIPRRNRYILVPRIIGRKNAFMIRYILAEIYWATFFLKITKHDHN